MTTTSTRDGGRYITTKDAEAVPKKLSGLVSAIHKSWQDLEGGLRANLAKAIEMGRQLNELREQCKHGEFGRWFSDHDQPQEKAFPFVSSWARKLMTMAQHPAISNRSHENDLPSDLNTVYELATMTAPALEAAIEAGKVTPATTRAEAKALKQEIVAGDATTPRERVKRIKPESEVYEDCSQAIEEAIGTALLAYPSLRATIAAMLRRIEKGMKNEH